MTKIACKKALKKVTGLVAKHFKKQCTQQCSSGAEVVLDSMASVNVVTAAVAVASLTFNRKGMLETRFSCREGFQIGEGSLILFPG